MRLLNGRSSYMAHYQQNIGVRIRGGVIFMYKNTLQVFLKTLLLRLRKNFRDKMVNP